MARIRIIPLWLATLLLGMLAAAAPVKAEELERVAGEASVSGTNVFMSGDDDQFRQRHGIPPDFTGGIDDLYAEWAWGEDGSIEVEGRGIVDANDWLARFKIERTDKGYLSGGYRQFRTWYDGTGGFFPQNSAIFSVFDEDLRLDRGEGWFEAGIRAPHVPEVTVRFAKQFRKGQKSSTSWGDTTQTGGFGIRSIVPSLYDIDEHRNLLDIDITHQIHGSDVGAGFLCDSSKVDNSLDIERTPGEATQRFVTQTNRIDGDLYGLHVFSSTPFLEKKLVFSTAYAYSTLDNQLGGSRIYGAELNADFDPSFPNRQPFDAGFIDLDGSTKVDQHVGTFTLQGRPSETLQTTAGLRVERSDVTGASDFIGTDVGFPPALATAQEPLAVKSDADTTSTTESIEVRYTGVPNWVLYVRGEWEENDGDLTEREIETTTSSIALERDTNIDLFGQKYVAGVNWYPLRRVNVSARYQYRNHDYDYDHGVDSTDNTGSDRYPAYITKQEIETNSGDVRVTWRPRDDLRLTGRYDIAYTDYRQQSDGLGDVESAKTRTHAAGANTNWNPTAASYVQTNLNYVRSYTETPAGELTGAAAGVLDSRFDNDYWTGSFVAGVALDEKTDLRAQYFYYRADDYQDHSALRQPFGTDAEEHGVAVMLGRQLRENLRWRLGYAYFTNDEKHDGGANGYDASLVTTSVDIKF